MLNCWTRRARLSARAHFSSALGQSASTVKVFTEYHGTNRWNGRCSKGLSGSIGLKRLLRPLVLLGQPQSGRSHSRHLQRQSSESHFTGVLLFPGNEIDRGTALIHRQRKVTLRHRRHAACSKLRCCRCKDERKIRSSFGNEKRGGGQN